ncbi:uncharacterized protein LOC111348202 [Spodoptera litura]|uniref:Uncharacterized protein LOC111348202 n=1 Tax=Spodoptera litura TaxID=69820 RepID=A0A9J7DQS1_SPOLT|nr:uncharacterized protein LOC111348202 [Spodoptera litura]
MLTRRAAAALRAQTHLPSPTSSPSSAPPPSVPVPDEEVPLTDAGASSSSDEYFSPPTTPPPSRRRRGGRRPSSRLGPRSPLASGGVPAPGGNVSRMKWTRSINENVMRAYFGATVGGSNLTAYRVRLLAMFQVLEPTINVSAQRLSDQVRVIQRNRMLDDIVLDRLRSEVLRSRVIIPLSQNVQQGQVDVDSVDTPNDDRTTEVSTHKCSEELRRALEDAIQEYRFVSPSLRPHLPRLPMHKKNRALMCALDAELSNYFDTSEDLLDTHSILYCGAIAACRVAHVKLIKKDNNVTRQKLAVPAWQCRIERRIDEARTLIAKLVCFREGNTRPRVMRFVRRAFSGTDIRPQDYVSHITERVDFLKQKIYAWANRIRRYKKRVKRYTQNRTFQRDQRWVYRTWEQKEQTRTDACLPNVDAMNSFWRSIWSAPVSHIEGDWIEEVEGKCELIPEMEPIFITSEDVSKAANPLANWKAPGPDGLHNFWIRWFISSHSCLASQFQSALESGSLPQFFTTGLTHLLHKSGSTTEPKNYRPITCLPTIYKLLTSILRAKLNKHIEDNNIMSASQNGCRNGSRGTKELLLIDMSICQQVRRSHKNLSTCWIDYKKAYDSVPHTWLMRVLELYKVDTALRTFLLSCMRQWRTVLRYPGCGQICGNDEPIRIERGIFQGDSLSPLWFCLALNPLSTLLEGSGLGYRLRRGGQIISHLLYMDDLKLFAPNNLHLMRLLNVTETFSNAIRMEFGVDKCAVLHVKRGEIVESDGTQNSDSTSFRPLSSTETYKYLGMSEALGIDVTVMKQSLRERFFGRLKKVLNSLLSGGNKVRAYNGWVMPVLMYSFGILKWTQTELDTLDRKVRSLLTEHRMHHPRSSIMRLYIPRKCGGRGFLNAKTLHNSEVCSLRKYFLKMDVGMHRDVVAVDKGLTPLSLANENWREPIILSTNDRRNVWQSPSENCEPVPIKNA